MGMKEKSGFGQQGNARQGLLGTLPVTLLGYEIKEYEDKNKKDKKGKPTITQYVDGRVRVAGSEHFSFFQIWPSQNKPDIVEEFQEVFADPEEEYETYFLCSPKQRVKEKEYENSKGETKTRNEFTTSLRVFAWKYDDEFDEKRDGFLTGTLLFVDDEDETFYRRAKEDKAAFAQLMTKAVSSFTDGAGKPRTTEDVFVLQCFDEAADETFKVLSSPGIADGVPLYVVATMRGGRLTIVEVQKSRSSAPATDEDEETSERPAGPPAPGPTKPSFRKPGAAKPDASKSATTTKPGASKPATTAAKPGFKKPGAVVAAAPEKKNPWKSRK